MQAALVTAREMPPDLTTSADFVHLRVHSEFSISDGTVRLDDLVTRAAEDGQGAVALTDLSNLFGLIRFYNAARGRGVKPIVGCDVWIATPDTGQVPGNSHSAPESERGARLLLLVRNHAGYLRLCQLLSRAWLENQARGRPELAPEWLEHGDNSGLIALSGAQSGDVGLALSHGQQDAAEACARRWARLFPDAYYLEIQRYGQPGAEPYIRSVVALAAQLRLPVVATHPVQFLTGDDFRAHEARVCIAEGEILASPRRVRRFTPEQSFHSRADMARLFADLPAALANSVEIARRCNLELHLGKPRLPLFPTPEGVTLDAYLDSQARAGLEQRLVQLFPDDAARSDARPRYEERLRFEIETIIKMGFPGYFLIVADFIGWAKNNGVPVGPGRGSGVGSLVAYALGITNLDPLEYNLLFERFLNPERVSMPDFDIDFCQEGRDRVIEYVRHKYGAASVAQIATFGTMAAKAAVRDIGRVLDMSFTFVDGIAKLIPFKPGKLVTLADARKDEPLLAEREQNEDEVRELLALAERVEGLTRNVGMHAGGVLIAPGQLTDFCPLYAQSGSTSVVSQYDKDDVEAAGLVKFDFLGLTTLTILDWASRHIRRLYPNHADFDVDRVSLKDEATFALLQRPDTVAVFQLESRGMQGMLKEARPDRFEDIIALVALYRPGPMDLIPDFIAHKKGEPFDYPDPRVEHILKETYGIMVYQEQVMQMAQIIGGYSLGAADLLRRAMGKKKPEEMAAHRAIFAEGAARNGLSQGKANELFDLMEKFAGYGFNKSHAAAYALLAYQTAWLKTHFPAEFMAANMSAALDDTDKVKILFEDCAHIGVSVLAPDINVSDYRFTPVMIEGDAERGRASAVRYGLGAIKGTGRAAIDAIVSAREKVGDKSGAGASGQAARKSFTDLFDFCARIDKRIVNRRVVEALVRAGAFDALDADRASLLASVGRALEAAEQAEAHANQNSLFDLDGASTMPVGLLRIAPWSEKKKLAEEKLALGFYFSGHLFDACASEARRIARTALADVQAAREPLWLAGIVAATRTQMTRRGKMLVVTLDDGSAQLDVTVYNELYEANRALLREDELLFVYGQVRRDDFNGGVRLSADKLMDIATARVQFARALALSMNGQSDAARLRNVLSPYRVADAAAASGCPVVIRYHSDTARCELTLGSDWRVLPDDRLLADLSAWLEPANVQVEYA